MLAAEKHGVCGNPVRPTPRTRPCSSAPGGIVILAMEATTNQEATVSGFTPTAEQETARQAFATGRSLAIEAGAGAGGEHRGTGFVGYSVTATGEVWSWWRHDTPPGAPWSLASTPQLRHSPAIAGSNGYEQVWLRREGKRYGRFVHVLVLEAFVGPRPPGGEARHLNGDQRDNRVVNLAWGTHAENTLDREIHGRTRRGSDVAKARLDSEAVAEIRAAFARGESMRSLARRFPVGRRQIGRIVRGESWS